MYIVTQQKQEFEYYCLDRTKPISEDITIACKNEDNIIKKHHYKTALQANIKHKECIVLYTETDEDLDNFVYTSTEMFYDNQERFFNGIFTLEEFKEIIKNIRTINVFEFTSLLNFTNIYEDFKTFIEYNWNIVKMDELIEL